MTLFKTDRGGDRGVTRTYSYNNKDKQLLQIYASQLLELPIYWAVCKYIGGKHVKTKNVIKI